MGTLVYLAAPYSHPDKAVVEARMEALCKTDAILMSRGIYTNSPLMKHYIIHHSDLPGDWSYWQNYAKTMLRHCSSMFVLTLDGWKESTGVQAEIELAKMFDIPVFYIDERGDFVV